MKSDSPKRLSALAVYALLAAGFICAAALPAPAQQPLPAGVKLTTSVEGITEYQLANGLKVLLFPDQTKQTITVNITYLVGSSCENYGETGMAHLLEHLLFKGSTNHTNISQEMTERGAIRNGSTSYDRTNYFETFTSSDDNLKWALELEADRMVNSFVAKKDLDSEMTVVRNELERGENSPTNILFERMLSTAFIWHNYGKSTIGATSDLENVPIDRLQAFYRAYYQPDNSVLLVAGKFDEAKTLDLVNNTFGAIPRPQRTMQKIYTSEPTQDGERSVLLKRVGDIKFTATMYHVPAGSHPDFAALDLLTEILGDTPSGRLYKVLVETKKATAAFASSFQLREPGVVYFGAIVPKDGNVEEARDEIIKTVESFASAPPTKEEVERARTSILKNFELALNNSQNVGLELSEWAAMGDWRLFFLHRDRIRKVTAEDVQRVAAAYLKQSNRTAGVFIPTVAPERAVIPAAPDLAAMLKDYKGEAAVAAGEAFDPSPSNIESRTKRAETSGVKTALLPKKTRGGSVVANITLHFGDEKSLMNRDSAAGLVGQMLMRGTAKHTRQQIQDEFDKLKARAFVFGSASQAGAFIETVRENLPAALKLVAEVLREPSFPADEFDQLKQQQLTGIEAQRSEPQSMAQLAFNRHLNPYPKGDPRYVETIDESIAELKAVTLEDLKKFYSDFYGASNMEISVVGDFDEGEISKLAGDLFGAWKSPRPFERLKSEYKDVSPINEKFEAPDKANAVFYAGMNLSIRDDDPDYPALAMAGFMLGGNSASRLRVRIRDKEGFAYTVFGNISAGSLDKAGSFFAFASYAPQNLARLEAAFKEEIDKVLREGFTADELAKSKSGFLQQRQVGRAQDQGLAGRLGSYLFLNRKLDWDAEFEKKISDLTVEQVNEAVRKYIDPSKITYVKAGDFAKASAQK